MTCECGHDLDQHGWSGCWGSTGGTPPRVCDCRRKPSDVAAARVADEADAPVPQRDADPAPADEQAIRERVARVAERLV